MLARLILYGGIAALSFLWQWIIGAASGIAAPLLSCSGSPVGVCIAWNIVLLVPYLAFPLLLAMILRRSVVGPVDALMAGLCCGGCAAAAFALQAFVEDPTGDDTYVIVFMALLYWGIGGAILSAATFALAHSATRTRSSYR